MSNIKIGLYEDLATYADEWAVDRGIDYAEYDDYSVDVLAIDFRHDGIDTEAKAQEYILDLAYRKRILT